MLSFLSFLARRSPADTSACYVCYHTVSHFDLLTAQNPLLRLTSSLAQTACGAFVGPEQQFCTSLINANFSAILALRMRRLSPFDICVNLSHCVRPPAPREDFAEGFQFRRPEAAPDVISQIANKIGNQVIDIKRTGEELIGLALKASKKVVDEGVEVVEKLGKSKEWRNLKKDARRAVDDAVDRWNEADETGN
jgi:hypothetical protein